MFQSCISICINIRIHIHIILVVFHVRSRAYAQAVVDAAFGRFYVRTYVVRLLATSAMKEQPTGEYETFFPFPGNHLEYCEEYWAMSHNASQQYRVFNMIATKMIPYLCDHTFEKWTADRHYDYSSCGTEMCACCVARTKRAYEPDMPPDVCQCCAHARRLYNVSKHMKDEIHAYGYARPRWWRILTAEERAAKRAKRKGYKPQTKKWGHEADDQPQDRGQPQADDTSGKKEGADEWEEHWRSRGGAKKAHKGYKPQWWESSGWGSSSSHSWQAAAWTENPSTEDKAVAWTEKPDTEDKAVGTEEPQTMHVLLGTADSVLLGIDDADDSWVDDIYESPKPPPPPFGDWQ